MCKGAWASVFPLLLAVKLLLAGSGHCADPEELYLSRHTAIEMAIRNNIEVRTEALGSVISEIELVRSRSIYNPYFSGSASTGVSSFPGENFRTRSTNASLSISEYLPTGGTITASTQTGFTTADSDNPDISSRTWQSAVGALISQPLLKNFGRENAELNIILSTTALKDSLQRFRGYISDTVLTVITSYNRLYTLRQILESRKAALDSSQALLNQIKAAKAGPLQPMEIANAEYAIVQRRKDAVEAERSVRDQEANFRYLIGLEAKTRIVPTEPPSREEPLETEEQAVKMALEFRPDVKQQQSSLATSQLQERLARHQTWPDVSVNVSGGFTGIGNDFGTGFDQILEGQGSYWTASMLFSYPIGNTAAENDYRRSKVRVEQVQNQLTALRWKIRNEVEADMRSLISARLQMQMADRSLLFAQQRLDQYRINNRAGTTTIQDVLNAENDLISTRNAQTDAIESFANAVSKLWRDIGVILDRQGVRIDVSQPAKLAGEKKWMPPSPVPGQRELSATGITTGRTPIPPPPGNEGVQQNGSGTSPGGKGFVLQLQEGKAQDGEMAAVETKKAATGEGHAAGKKRRIRIFIGEFADQSSTRARMKELSKATSASFFTRTSTGQYRVYAGSYANPEYASLEQKRLHSFGINATLEEISLPSKEE